MGLTRLQPGACCGCTASVASCHVCDMPASIHVVGPYDTADYAFVGCSGGSCIWQGLATQAGCTPCPAGCAGQTGTNGTICQCYTAKFACSGGALPTITLFDCTGVASSSLGPPDVFDCANRRIQWFLTGWLVTW